MRLSRKLLMTDSDLRWYSNHARRARAGVSILVGALLLAACSRWPLKDNKSSEHDLVEALLLDSPHTGSSQRSVRVRSQSSNKRIGDAFVNGADDHVHHLRLESVDRCLSTQGLPAESHHPAHPTNYDQRMRLDANGKPVLNIPMIIVLHETVVSEEETLNLFRTPHNDDDSQASYHVLIPEDGRRVRIVADANRAFGAGNSAYQNYSIRLKPGAAGSINNIALHLSLVSPSDGRGEAPTHSGYSDRQYKSAAGQVLLWQAHYGIPLNRLTTHRAVDQSKTRTDPRSFAWDQFLAVHRQIARHCGLQALAWSR